jgi:uncharacterized membrane protein
VNDDDQFTTWAVRIFVGLLGLVVALGLLWIAVWIMLQILALLEKGTIG